MVEDLVKEFIQNIDKSVLLVNYRETLVRLRNDAEAKRVFDEYRKYGKIIQEKHLKNEILDNYEVEQYQQAAREFSKYDVIQDFLKYDSDVYEMVNTIIQEVRKCIERNFKETYDRRK